MIKRKGVGLRPKGLKRVAGQIKPNKAKSTPYAKVKKKAKTDIYREYFIPEYIIRGGGLKTLLRYSDPLRGIYWYYLSKDVRKKEWEKWRGLCITCLGPIERWQDGQCGHMVPSSMCGEFLRFDRRNLTIQHGGCNNPRFTPQAGALNAIHYDQRYGQGAWQALYDLRKTDTKIPSQTKLKELIEALDSFQEAKQLSTPTS